MILAWACAVIVATQGATARPECASEVTRLFEVGQHVASARAAEACWSASRDPVLMYFAAQARASAGQLSHAIVWFRRYLSQIPDDAPLRAGAERRLEGILRMVEAVALVAPAGRIEFWREGQEEPLVIGWPGGAGTIHLERGAWRVRRPGAAPERRFEASAGARWVLFAPAVRVPDLPRVWPITVRIPRALARPPGARLELRAPGGTNMALRLRSPTTQLSLAAGTWEVTLRASGREAVAQRLRLGGPVELAFTPGLDRATRARIGLGVGIAVASLGVFGAGAAWAAAGGRVSRATDWHNPAEVQGALDGYARTVDGATMLAAGSGGLAVAITNASGVRRTALMIETASGLVAAVGGGAWALTEREQWVESEGAPRDVLEERRPYVTAASVMLGLGAGTALTGALSLITLAAMDRRSEPVQRLEPSASPWHVGLRGRF